MAAVRNVLAHEYLAIDLETVWEIVKRDVPASKEAVRRMTETPR